MGGTLTRAVGGVAAVACLVAASSGLSADRPLVISAGGIAGVRFGLPRAESVGELTRVLGRPSRMLINSGCGGRYTEVAWGHLYVEFRDRRLTGFRYMRGTWLPQRRGVRPPDFRLLQPKLATSTGISLGSTLAQLRSAYGGLSLVGTDRWQTDGGLIFYDDARREPPPPSSRIIEIKYGTCGDF